MLASKAVIFTHMPIPLHGQPTSYTASMARKLTDRIKPYIKAYLLCKNIGLVYVYVDTGVRLTLEHLSEATDTLKFSIAELEFEQNTRNCLKLAVDKAISDLYRDPNCSFDLSSAPKFQFIGLPHLYTLIHSLYRIDRTLLEELAGRDQRFTYDSPKFVEAVIRLARGSDPIHAPYPIFRIDEDVEINETAIGLLLDEAREAMQNMALAFFSGGYGRYNEPLDPVNDYAIRLHWLVDRNTHTLTNQARCFLRDLGECGATQVATDSPLSNAMADFIQKRRKGKSANRVSQQVISGAGLFMSRKAIRTLPPFMNFRTLVTWIDDHLKRRLHEVLGHINPPNDDIEHVDNALFIQNRHKGGITDEDIEWARNVYFERLLSGCILHTLITTPEGEKGVLAVEVETVIQSERMTLDEEDLRKRLTETAIDTATSVLHIWKRADYGSAMLSQWADDMSQRIFSPLFYMDDLKDPALLVRKLLAAKDPLSQFLREEFSTETQQQIEAFDGSASPTEALQEALIRELNKLLKGISLFDERRFAKIKLTRQIQILVKQKPEGDDLIRLNRLLLEEAYPQEISRDLISNIINDSISYIRLVSRWYQYVGAIEKLTPIHAYWLFRKVTSNV